MTACAPGSLGPSIRRTRESSKRFKRDVIMWIVTGFVRPCSPATKRLSAWRGKSTGSKVPLSLARKRNSSGATWRLMIKNLHYVAEHTSAASNQGKTGRESCRERVDQYV